MGERSFSQLPEDKSLGPDQCYPKFLVSRGFSDISDYVPMLELLRKGNGRGGSWINDVGAETEQVQFLRALSPGFYFPRTAGAF